MIETREKVIGGATYTVTQLPARRALRLKAKLIKSFGPALAQFFLAATSEKDADERNSQLVKAIEILSCNIDENSFEALVIEMLNGVRKNGLELTPPTIDLEFAGDMASLYQVLFFVIEVNYSNFLEIIGIGNQSPSDQPVPSPDTKKTFIRK